MSSNQLTTQSAPARPEIELPPPVIEVHNLVKEYRLGALEGLRTLGRRLLGRAVPPRQQFRALDDVSMTIRRGEVVGIIGHNGAGKSTLLKLLCGITKPTSGTLNVNGRIAPLIEVGAGLVGDMTGRENIYLNATILGLTRAQIDHKVDEIIEFAELEKFIDTPIKRYSSGMQVRLGYAIATAVDSEVLIIDEVLAVGDLQFQRKSIERMQRLIKETGRTVLIVGHNIRQLERVCSRIIMLDGGKVRLDGKPSTVINLFYELLRGREVAKLKAITAGGSERNWIIETSGEVSLEDVVMRDGATAQPASNFRFGEPFDVDIVVTSKTLLENADIGICFMTMDFLPVAISELTSAGPESFSIDATRRVIRCRFHSPSLMPGIYSLRVGIKDAWGQLVWGGNNIHPFEISVKENENQARYSDFAFIKFSSSWRSAD